jgi:hypothetical protein
MPLLAPVIATTFPSMPVMPTSRGAFSTDGPTVPPPSMSVPVITVPRHVSR